MCLILFAYRVHPEYPLVLAANRDEYLARPTAPVGFWSGNPDILAGRDLVGGGTWLGVSRNGRWAAVTNVREPAFHADNAPSRGVVVSQFLESDLDPAVFAAALGERASVLNGFNLLLGSPETLAFVSNRGPEPGRPVHRIEAVGPGIHGLSNATMDTPWTKVERGRNILEAHLLESEPQPEALFDLLADETVASDRDLPDTGVGLELERALSPARIRLPHYGTRSSTVLLVSSDGHVTFLERTWPRGGGVPETRRYRFRIQSP